jgi:BON domain
MTKHRLDAEDHEFIEEIQALQGEEMPIDQDALLEPHEIEARRTPTQTELDRGEPSPDRELAAGPEATLDGLALDRLREGETDDPDVATEEGLTWIPPMDPPVRPDTAEPEGLVVGAGTGTSALDEPYDRHQRSGELSDEPELTARVREALLADSATSDLADRLAIATRGSTVVIRGQVADVYESDAIVAVAGRVTGIAEVVDETELPER